jgi:hypothetical protein
MISSKFTKKAFLIPIFFTGLTGFFVYFLLQFWDTSVLPDTASPRAFRIAFFPFVIVWLFFGELRTKMIKVTIEDDHIFVNRFGGLLSATRYSLKDFSGFKTSHLRSRGGVYEYLYLMQSDKKAVKISEYYHSNYSTLKAELQPKIEDLGFEEFSFGDEMKEIFT